VQCPFGINDLEWLVIFFIFLFDDIKGC